MKMLRVAESASGIINPAETQGGRSSKEARKCEGKNTLRLTRTHRAPHRSISGSVPKPICTEFGSFPGATVGIHLEL